MESPPPVVDAPARRNRTPYTIALVALVLCGCCIALIIAGYYYYRQNILTVPDLSTETAPTPVPVPTDASILPTSAPSGDVGEPPEGGLTDDALVMILGSTLPSPRLGWVAISRLAERRKSRYCSSP